MLFLLSHFIIHTKLRRNNIILKRYDGLPRENRVAYQYVHQSDGIKASLSENFILLVQIFKICQLKRNKGHVNLKQSAKKEMLKIQMAKYMVTHLQYTFQILLKSIYVLQNIKINVRSIWRSNWTILILRQPQTWKLKQYQLDAAHWTLKVKCGRGIIVKFLNRLEQLIQGRNFDNTGSIPKVHRK